jgi:hypothetical protein
VRGSAEKRPQIGLLRGATAKRDDLGTYLSMGTVPALFRDVTVIRFMVGFQFDLCEVLCIDVLQNAMPRRRLHFLQSIPSKDASQKTMLQSKPLHDDVAKELASDPARVRTIHLAQRRW